MGWVLGDFCLAQEYRSLGPALELQRACLEGMQPPFDFCYDFPSKSMMAVYTRLGVKQTGTMVRWAKPLRVEEKLEPLVRSKSAARALGRIGNAVLAARGWKGHKDACKVALHQGLCSEEFDILDTELSKLPGVRAQKTAAYLNWRYLARPRQTHEILVARRNSVLVGYAVIRNESENPRIVDLNSIEDPAVVANLIDASVSSMRVRRAKAVHLVSGEDHPWSPIFERTGFRRRETSPLVVVARKGATIGETEFKTNFYLMEGERDS